jgi:pyruvate kinase
MGPACSSAEVIENLLQAGMNCARMNFSHGSHADHKKMIKTIRTTAQKLDRSVAILQDLQGPKIRTGDLEEGRAISLSQGDKIWITTRPMTGTKECISTTYKALVRDVKKGSRILIDDGRIELVVSRMEKEKILCRTVVGGEVGQHKGINLPGIPVSAPAMTKKDWEDLTFGLKQKVNAVALSFVRRAEDIRKVRRFLGDKHAHVQIIAKIERPEALDDLAAILDAADGVMVARGDLGVEIDPARVAIVQKEIIHMANIKRKIVITATHMLDSMVSNPRPTRAEISDVSNAIYDGTDAVMLSGETATGKYPVRAVRMMSRIITEVEKDIFSDVIRFRRRRGDNKPLDLLSTLVEATCQASNLMRCSCLGVFTTSGATARSVAKGRPYSRIIAFTSRRHTYELLSMAWGVHPIMIPRVQEASKLYSVGTTHLLKKGLVKKGETILMIAGTSTARGSTNTIRFHKVERSN